MTLDIDKPAPTGSSVPTERPLRAAARLRRRCDPTPIHLPGEPSFERARLAWNTAVDLQPAAVAEPASDVEVSQVVAVARSLGLHVAPQSTGHNAGPLTQHDLSTTVLVKTTAMTAVSIDATTRTARVEGGALWGDVVAAAGRRGLACLHGSSPDVGVTGYCLGGGVFFYGRKLGLATNRVTAVELVLADGSLVRADRNQHRELFWALRGGGGNFGVVTALEFTLFPIQSVWAGMMVWPSSGAEKVVRRWARWAPEAPEEVTTSLRMLNLPALPELPAAVRGRSVVCIDGAVLGGAERGRRILAALRELRPELDTFASVPPTALSRLHMDPEGPTPVVGASALLEDLPGAGVDNFLAAVGPGSTSTLPIAELRQLGGALARPHPDGGVMCRLDGQFMVFGSAIVDTPSRAERGLADARALTGALQPWNNGHKYLNFVEGAVDPSVGYSQGAWGRLAQVRSAYDAEGLFVANHQIPLAG